MTKPTTDEKVALHVKAFIANDSSHRNSMFHSVGNTDIQKCDEGIISVFVNDERILIMETSQDKQSGFRPTSSMAVKRLNAIKEALRLEFDLAWIKGKPHALNGKGNYVLLDKPDYSANELSNITYS